MNAGRYHSWHLLRPGCGEMRDRETGLLTRQAYLDIGGVGGALARHAEATVDRIGVERIPIVRELFRNLVTAEGTRAVREWGELLSVFDTTDVSREGINPSPTKEMWASKKQNVGAGFIPAREAAEEVLRELIDARLLTSYEIREDEHEPIRRVEIIHESLLANWPRLVRWQTQDADGAQLRDQLRQAAQTWDERGRSDDMLWTASAYREFASWRERYPGGLSESEEAFGSAMVSLAGRRRRRRRMVVTAVMAALLAGLAIVGAFWQRSIRETRRAEAAYLLSLGQLELEGYPTATVAHATASLELTDSPDARHLALEALWRGPTAFVASEEATWQGNFSPDGQWIVQSLGVGVRGPHIRVFSPDGSAELLEQAHEAAWIYNWMGSASDVFISNNSPQGSSWIRYVLWGLPEKRKLAEALYEDPVRISRRAFALNSTDRRLVMFVEWEGKGSIDTLSFDGVHGRLGTLDFDLRSDVADNRRVLTAMDRLNGRWLGVMAGNEVYVIEIGDHSLSEPRRLGRMEGAPASITFDPNGRFFATANNDGLIKLWDPIGRSETGHIRVPNWSRGFAVAHEGSLLEVQAIDSDEFGEASIYSLTSGKPRLLGRFDLGSYGTIRMNVDPVGRRYVATGSEIRLWNLGGPANAEPLSLVRGDNGGFLFSSFHPRSGWLAVSETSGLSLWPLTREYPAVIRQHTSQVTGLEFEPEGRWLASAGFEDFEVWLWPLDGENPAPGRLLFEPDDLETGLAISPDGEHVLVGSWRKGVRLISLSEGVPRSLPGFEGAAGAVAFSHDGRLAAGSCGLIDSTGPVIRVWDVETQEEITVLDPEETLLGYDLQFTTTGNLLSDGSTGLVRLDVVTGDTDLLYEGRVPRFAASRDGQRILLLEQADKTDPRGWPVLLELDSGKTTQLGAFGEDVSVVAIDSDGSFAVTGDSDGEIRVGLLTGENPHLLIGHQTGIVNLAIDPQGRWIASGDRKGTIRLWPMPDLSKPPLHTLPREELIAKLKTLTNLRVVRDEDSPTGWKLTHDPFPGWETVPTW